MKRLFTFFCYLLIGFPILAQDTLFPDLHNQLASDQIRFVPNAGQVINSDGNNEDNVLFHSIRTLPISFFYDNRISFSFPKIDQDTATLDTIRSIDFTWMSESAYSRTPNGVELTDEKINYYIPQCTTGCDGLNIYKGLEYSEIYDGIKLRIYSNKESIKMYFIIEPGADPNKIRLNFNGQENRTITNYLITLNSGENSIFIPCPISYTIDGSGNTSQLNWSPIFLEQNDGSIELFTNGQYYDNTKNLVFEISAPTLSKTSDLKNIKQSCISEPYTNYWDIDFDLEGNPLVSGNVNSSYLVANSFNNYLSTSSSWRNEVLIRKYNPFPTNTSPLISWTTVMGGSGSDGDFWFGLSHNSSNQVFFSAITESTNMYLKNKTGAWNDQTNSCSSLGGTPMDQIISKLDIDGKAIWASYFGGSESNVIPMSGDIIVDQDDNIYMSAIDEGVPVNDPNGNFYQSVGSAYIVKFSGSTLYPIWCSYFGDDNPNDGAQTFIKQLGIDANNKVLMTGFTSENPVQGFNIYSGNMYHHSFNTGDPYDAFISRFSSNLTLDWSTYLGGAKNDFSNRININSSGGVSIGGNTLSSGVSSSQKFPIVQNTGATNFSTYSGTTTNYDAYFCCNISGDAFVTTFDPNSLEIKNSTFIGGTKEESVFGLASNPETNDLFVVGHTTNGDLPNLPNQEWFLYHSDYKGDYEVFTNGFNSNFEMNWATYVGSSNWDQAHSSGMVGQKYYIVGQTINADIPNEFPFTHGSINKGIRSAYIMCFDLGLFPLGMEENKGSIKNDIITIYPNPTMDKLTITMNNFQNKKINKVLIKNLTGDVIKTKLNNDALNLFSIDISEMAQGTYIIEIFGQNDTQIIRKFIKN